MIYTIDTEVLLDYAWLTVIMLKCDGDILNFSFITPRGGFAINLWPKWSFDWIRV